MSQTCAESIEKEQKEIPMVFKAHTIIYPRAMVVQIDNALVAG
jgi:hypothetical protein